MSIEKNIIDLCESYGYGRVMQAASEQWSKKADAMGFGGSHLVIGPCGSKVEPCECEPQHQCVWCCGSGWLTSHVKSLKTASEE
jgi:hypothetical protein